MLPQTLVVDAEIVEGVEGADCAWSEMVKVGLMPQKELEFTLMALDDKVGLKLLLSMTVIASVPWPLKILIPLGTVQPKVITCGFGWTLKTSGVLVPIYGQRFVGASSLTGATGAGLFSVITIASVFVQPFEPVPVNT